MLRVRTSFTGIHWQYIAFIHVELQCHELRKTNALGYSTFRCDPDLGVLQYDPRVPPKETLFVRRVKVERAVCVSVLAQCYAEKQALWEVNFELLDTRVNPAVWEA
ncbi:hypothetical protein Tco_1213195 [Tanacetum coccineum]